MPSLCRRPNGRKFLNVSQQLNTKAVKGRHGDPQDDIETIRRKIREVNSGPLDGPVSDALVKRQQKMKELGYDI